MKFGLVHRLMTDALAAIGLLALVTSGKLHPLAVGFVVLGALIAFTLPERYRVDGYLKVVSAGLPLATLALELTRLVGGAEPIPVIVEFAAALQVMRIATRRGAAHDHQVILLALLHLIAGTVLGGGLTYAFALVGFLIFTPGALVLSHLRREVEGNYRQGARDRTGSPVDVPRILRSRRVIDRGFLLFTCLLSVPVFLFTAVLFLMFPRVGFAWLSVAPIQPTRMVGFSDRVDLGGVGTIRSDPTLVLRVVPNDMGEAPPLRRNLYLRGALFDSYNGRSWSRTLRYHSANVDSGNQLLLRGTGRIDFKNGWKFDLEPIEPAVLFVPGDAVAVRAADNKFRALVRPPLLSRGPNGEILYQVVEQQGLSYEVFFSEHRVREPELLLAIEAPAYLTVPTNLDPKITAIAEEWTQGLTTPLQMARRVETRLQREFKYDLASPSGAAKDPLLDFLTVSRRGHCEFYSTAMAVLLRTRGIATRNVTGFVGGTYNRFGNFYAVRQGDAHSWVEVYLPDQGWTRFDPTPPAQSTPQGSTGSFLQMLREMGEAAAQSWEQNVVSFDLDKQMRLFQSIGRALRGEADEAAARTKGSKNRPTTRQWLLLAAVVGGVVIVGFALRRRFRSTFRAERIEPRIEEVIELYRRLERTLALRGVPRPPGTPPLVHANALDKSGHPTGPETLRLTKLYARARFGGERLDEHEIADFERAVRDLERPGQDQAA